MLKLIENLSAETARQLSAVLPEDSVTSYVLFSLLDWYTADGAWVQDTDGEITALLVEKGQTKLFVAASENADFEEIGQFIRCLGGLVVHCAAAVTKKIGITPFSKLSLMSLCVPAEGGRHAVTLTDGLRPAFELLTKDRNEILGESVNTFDMKRLKDRAYKEWLSKTSRGILNGYTTVKAIMAGENAMLSVAVADTLGQRVYIRDVATDSGFRKLGYASDCIRGLCAELKTDDNEVFLACDDLKTENFYKKLGFQRKDYIELGIVEL